MPLGSKNITMRSQNPNIFALEPEAGNIVCTFDGAEGLTCEGGGRGRDGEVQEERVCESHGRVSFLRPLKKSNIFSNRKKLIKTSKTCIEFRW